MRLCVCVALWHFLPPCQLASHNLGMERLLLLTINQTQEERANMRKRVHRVRRRMSRYCMYISHRRLKLFLMNLARLILLSTWYVMTRRTWMAQAMWNYTHCNCGPQKVTSSKISEVSLVHMWTTHTWQTDVIGWVVEISWQLGNLACKQLCFKSVLRYRVLVYISWHSAL